MERSLYIAGPINECVVNEISKGINNIRLSDNELINIYKTVGGIYKPEPIVLFINSYGGQVYPTLSLIAQMETITSTPINTCCFGYAFSAAFLLFISGQIRFASKRVTFMIHQLQDLLMGTTNDIIIDANEMVRLQGVINKIIYERTKIDREFYISNISKGNWYMDAQESRKHGIIDALLVTKYPVLKKKAKTINNSQKQNHDKS